MNAYTQDRVELSIDIDEPDVRRVSVILGTLRGMYPKQAIYVRRSSSGQGWHVYMRGVWFAPREAMRLRKDLGDCAGRLLVDDLRDAAGLTTSTLFASKGKIDAQGQVVVKKAGEWVSAERWLKIYSQEAD